MRRRRKKKAIDAADAVHHGGASTVGHGEGSVGLALQRVVKKLNGMRLFSTMV